MPQSFDRIVRTVCSPNCTGTCAVNAFVRDDRIVKLEPASYPDPRYERICLKGIAMATQRVHAPERLTHPMIRTGERGEGKWRQVSWEEAYGYLAEKLTHVARNWGSKANAWMSMTGNYGIKSIIAPIRVANAMEGTTFNNLGMMGDGNCPTSHKEFFGQGFVGQRYEDHIGAKLILMIAKNTADTAHSEMHFLFDAMDAGATIISIDPRFSRTAAKADHWIPIRPGTDAALILGMIAVIREAGLIDEPYVAVNTNAPFLVHPETKLLLRERDIDANGSDAFLVWDDETGGVVRHDLARRPRLRGSVSLGLVDDGVVDCCTAYDAQEKSWASFTPEMAAEICEIPVEQMRWLGMTYGTTKPASILIGQGAQRTFHGHTSFRAAMTLGALCGNIGKAHAGVNWMDGPLLRMIYHLDFNSTWVSPDGKFGSLLSGVRMIETIANADPYPVKSLWLTNYGFGTQSARFKDFVERALPNLELFAVTEQVMTRAAEYADIVLPCVSYFEEELDIVPSGEIWYVQLRQRAIPPVGVSKSDWEIFSELMERMGRGGPWRMSAEEVCEGILRDHGDPYFTAIDWQQLKRDGVAAIPMPKTFIPFENLNFPTESGKMHVYQERLADFGEEVLRYQEPLESNRRKRAGLYPLTMLNSHHVHSVHSQHLDLPYIRELLPEPRLDMHPRDARHRGIADGDLVRVFNDRGAFKLRVTLTEAIKPGSVNAPQGWNRKHYVEGHHGDVMHLEINPAQDRLEESNFAIFDNLVQVEKAA